MCKRAWPTTREIFLPVPMCGTPLSYVTRMPLHQGSKKLSRGKAFRMSRAAPRLRLHSEYSQVLCTYKHSSMLVYLKKYMICLTCTHVYTLVT